MACGDNDGLTPTSRKVSPEPSCGVVGAALGQFSTLGRGFLRTSSSRGRRTLSVPGRRQSRFARQMRLANIIVRSDEDLHRRPAFYPPPSINGPRAQIYSLPQRRHTRAPSPESITALSERTALRPKRRLTSTGWCRSRVPRAVDAAAFASALLRQSHVREART
jgi:hypothetical protein